MAQPAPSQKFDILMDFVLGTFCFNAVLLTGVFAFVAGGPFRHFTWESGAWSLLGFVTIAGTMIGGSLSVLNGNPMCWVFEHIPVPAPPAGRLSLENRVMLVGMIFLGFAILGWVTWEFLWLVR